MSTELPGTYERCLAGGRYYPVVRGDEECPICERITALEQKNAELGLTVNAKSESVHFYIAQWEKCLTLLGSVETRLNAMTGQQCSIEDNLALIEQRSENVRKLVQAARATHGGCKRCKGTGTVPVKHGTTYITDSDDEIALAYHDEPCPTCAALAEALKPFPPAGKEDRKP